MQITKGKAFWLATTIAGSAAFSLGAAVAQSPAGPAAPTEASQDEGTEEVVVTARRIQENVQDVPISMSVVTGAKLEQARGFTVESLNNIVPNIKVFKTVGNSNSYSIFIRGIGRDNNAFIIEAPIATYVDDVYYPYPTGLVIDNGGLERVEVLRGPQGTLYGRNATVGAIKYVTKRPSLVDEAGAASFTYGSYGRRETRLSYSAPLIEHELGVRFDIGHNGYGGYMEDVVTGDHLGGVDSLSGRMSVLYRPTDQMEIYFSIDALQSRDDLNVGTPNTTVNGVVTPVYGSVHKMRNVIGVGPNNLDVNGGTFQLTYDFEFGTFKSVSAYRDIHQRYTIDANSGFSAPAILLADNNDSTFTQEFQLTGDLFSNRLKYVLGFFYLDSSTRSVYARAATAATNATDYNTSSTAVYFDGTYAITDDIHVSAGIRYTKDSKDAITTRSGPAPNFTVGGEESWSAVTPRVGADWQITDNIMIYGNWGKGFKAGGLATLEPSQPAAAAVFVPPEKITSTEIGVKTAWWGGRVVFNVNYFWGEYTDQAQTILAGNPLVTNVVFADAQVEGLELELHARVTDNWRIDATAGTLDNYFTFIPVGNPAANFADRTLKHSPRFAYMISTDYTFDKPLGVGGTLALGATYSWTDDTWESVQKVPLAFQPAYGTLDLRAVYTTEDDKYQVVLAGTNVTDTEYFKVVTVNFTRWYAPPAEWTLTFRAKF